MFAELNMSKDSKKWQLVNILQFPKSKDYGKQFRSFQKSNFSEKFYETLKQSKNLRSLGNANLVESYNSVNGAQG